MQRLLDAAPVLHCYCLKSLKEVGEALVEGAHVLAERCTCTGGWVHIYLWTPIPSPPLTLVVRGDGDAALLFLSRLDKLLLQVHMYW